MTRLLVAAVLLAGALAGCPAVYPELGTRTHTLPLGQPLDPPPPDDLRWIRFVSARVPERTRGGRPWQANGKASPYAKLMVNGVELLRTNPQSNTLNPTWPDGPRGNFKVLPTDRLRVELWDADPLNDAPIGVRELGTAGDVQIVEGQIQVAMEGGQLNSPEVVLAFAPAHAVNGVGLWYELRTVGCAITRTLAGSPAERAGLLPGDEVLRVDAREVKGMSSDELRSAFNAIPFDGLKLVVRHVTGAAAEVTLKEGPIYPTFAQFGPID